MPRSDSARSQLRRAARYSLRELVHDSGVSRSTLSSWERGETTLSDEWVRRVAFAIFYRLKATPKFVSVEDLTNFLMKEGT